MDIGYLFALFGFLTSVYASYSFFSGSFSKSKRKAQASLKRGEQLTYTSFVFFLISYLILTYYFLIHDFSYYYVYSYSDTKLSTAYLISAVWAGREGSLLLWILYLALLSVLALKMDAKDKVLATSLGIVLAFTSALTLLILTASNPFVKMDFTPPEGYGLNPLLRTPEMALHPPTIFLGYAAGIFPFAYAASSLLHGEEWRNRVRFWTLLAWIFLSIGILLGGWWAYKTLGWGGYWAWDPVENASLLPWITATALLHGIMRKRFEALNYYLALATAALVILATFITRSGIIESVHAFGENPEGPVYLFYLAALIVVGVAVERKVKLKLEVNFEPRELTIFLKILIFVLSLVTILLGTLAPTLFNVAVGREYYNRIEIPLGVMLVILLGICISLDWVYRRDEFLKRLKVSIVVGLISFVLAYFTTKLTIASVGVGIFAFSLVPHLLTLKQGINVRKIGGYVTHVGLLLLFIGVMSSWIYEEHYNLRLDVNEETNVKDYTLLLKNVRFYEDEEKSVVEATVEVFEKGELVATLQPKQLFYKLMRQDRVVSGVDIESKLTKDYYMALSGFSKDYVFVEFYVVPLVSFVWIGSTLMIVGGIISASKRG
ncbi:cytochrome c assembly protein [Ferroglobus placidus DSM 10642]|uniref:Cytochrome c assembly protein n=1 Tax=Ferroglobus placidus (strain DSM 10642 / AEDII12DO) TaxID=589924 RepID=D3RWZ9_FERPA|nr:cytochrome c biogenesis protein CcsA [Ferroglobus placidus]ADC65012.1 cytochrome c assembly protein [Ferroglobus placidus DSM 10642]